MGSKRITGGKQQNFTAAWKRAGKERVQFPSVYGLTREPFFWTELCFKVFILCYEYLFACTHLCIPPAPGVHGGQERALDPLKLE